MDEIESFSLDPAPGEWDALREKGHRMLDDMFDYLEHLRERPVWQPPPTEVCAHFAEPLPESGAELEALHARFMQEIVPYAVGNAHPAFMGWVHGGGTPVGMLAEMLAAGLNANLGGRNQMPVEVERQIVRWMRALFCFPQSANGVFVSGTSTANFVALLVARTARLGCAVRRQGLAGRRLLAYASAGAHSSLARAMDMAGLGGEALRRIPLDSEGRMNVTALHAAIRADRDSGGEPFFIAATAGSVDTGAIDPLPEIAAIARSEALWFHVDGAFGALARLSPSLAAKLGGIEQADSIACDFHKWLHVPYDAGFALLRDGDQQLATFSNEADYLGRETRGLAGGSPWPCDLGPELSRGFRALKTWFTLKAYGTERLARVIEGCCRLACYLAQRIEDEDELELLAPVALNIVCFRYRAGEAADDINRDIVIALHEAGVAAPSTTRLNGRLAIRCAIVNHRTNQGDIDTLLEGVLAQGRKLSGDAHE